VCELRCFYSIQHLPCHMQSSLICTIARTEPQSLHKHSDNLECVHRRGCTCIISCTTCPRNTPTHLGLTELLLHSVHFQGCLLQLLQTPTQALRHFINLLAVPRQCALVVADEVQVILRRHKITSTLLLLCSTCVCGCACMCVCVCVSVFKKSILVDIKCMHARKNLCANAYSASIPEKKCQINSALESWTLCASNNVLKT